MTLLRTTSYILCQIPPEWRAALAKGAIRLTGSVLRDTKTGRIMGFLQEAGPLGKMVGVGAGLVGTTGAGLAVGPGAMAAGAIAMGAMQVGSLVQGEATRRGVKRTEAVVNRVDEKVDRLGEGMNRVEDKLGVMHEDMGSIGNGVQLLKSMGVANLALGATGIGVSVVGFGIMSAKLNQVQRTIQSMDEKLDSISDKIDRLRQDAIDADFSDLLSLTGLYEEGWGFLESARAEQQWQHVQQAALVVQNRFADRARKLLSASITHFEAADSMLDAVALASGLRVASLVACNESNLARSVASESSREIESLTGTVGLADLATNWISEDSTPGTHDYELALVSAREKARPMLRKTREREAAAATRAAPLATLEQRGIKPRAWLESARMEEESPILVLPAEE